MASPNLPSTSRKLFNNENNENMETTSVKRPVGPTVSISQKKVKASTSTMVERLPFWLGFSAMNEIAKATNESKEPTLSVSELEKGAWHMRMH